MNTALSRREALLGATFAAAGLLLGANSASASAASPSLASPSAASRSVGPESAGGVRVMPLGDSLTDGFTPYPGGYRVGLWQRLTADGHTVDFVGSQSNGPAELGDHDHEGHSGWRIDQLDANIDAWFPPADPRTVLLLIGTNDLNQNHDIAHAPDRLARLIDHIRAAAPRCELLVATVPPQSNATLESRVRAYNAAIPQVVAAKGPQTHLVAMYDALTTADLADGIHPTQAGYAKMAAVWYEALRAVPGSLEPLRSTTRSRPSGPSRARS
ncbi:SGNH hydrolase [Streptomyces sp. SID5785]|uniref:SGNH/GDSL hydrolase family protein n=1 Tax=Streptomyces sp. SID5785 TaxID=2690309 RepID=UPI00136157BD|nr:SGNH/GDSL hydrolase family protein [Streptomyces sp. SID5785]MZD10047.1 SGNH hydrolase [Streptomyces sp. SID5785]